MPETAAKKPQTPKKKKPVETAELKEIRERRQEQERETASRLKRIQHAIAVLTKKIARRKKKRGAGRSTDDALIERYIAEIHRCIGLDLGYVWGGGHGSTPSPHNGPWDCSSYACHLDQTVSRDVRTGTTFTMASDGAAGEHGLLSGAGKYITHFIKNSPASDAHVITRIVYKGRVIWTETGGRDNSEHGGPCIFRPTASRIAEFPTKVHPKGL